MKISVRFRQNKKMLFLCPMIVTLVNLCAANSHSNDLQQSKGYQNNNHHRQHQEHHSNSNSNHNKSKSYGEYKFKKIQTNASVPLHLRRIINYDITKYHAQNSQYYNSNGQRSYSGVIGRNTGSANYQPVGEDIQLSHRSIPSVGRHGILRNVETLRYDNGRQIPRNSDPTLNPDRHICMQQKTIHIPIKTTEVYSRPIYRHITKLCNSNHLCTRVHVYHEPTYRDVITHKQSKQITYDCCEGWSKFSKNSTDCLKPICNMNCKNGGTCLKPETCNCTQGFTGRGCETDINECKENKPCDQLCYNTDGSYYCKCKEGFRLHSDMQSCKKISTDDSRDIAFEARDLENEIISENGNGNNNVVASRVHHIEKLLENERVKTNEIEKSVRSTYYIVNSLKSRLSTLENIQQPLQESLIDYGTKIKILENLINLLIKCRKNPNSTYCPQ